MHLEAVGNLGAYVHNVALDRELSQFTVNKLHHALAAFGVLIFRNQSLDAIGLQSFAKSLGPLHIHDYIKGVDGAPEVHEIHRRHGDKQVFGGAWHSDGSYHVCPPMAGILAAKRVPNQGGETAWLCQQSAWASLTQRMKQRVEQLRGCHSAERAYGSIAEKAASRERQGKVICAQHPLVRAHPLTGLPSLFHAGACTFKVVGEMSAETHTILDEVWKAAISSPRRLQHRWAEGDVGIWDNRFLLHRAYDDCSGEERLMHRVLLRGGKVTPYISDRSLSEDVNLPNGSRK